MPFRGLMNTLFGHQDDGIQQGHETIIHDPNRDAFAYQNQVQQQTQQISNQLIVNQLGQANQLIVNQLGQANQLIVNQLGQAYQPTLYREMRSYYDACLGGFYHVPIEFDLSNATTLKMCEIIKKAIEGLSEK